MLDKMRENAQSVLTYVLFGIIIVVFVVSFGPGSKGCSGTSVRGLPYAAKVNGSVINQNDYERQYAQTLRMYQQQSGGQFSRELAEQLGLRDQVMDRLVDRELVIQEAGKHGLSVSDDDVSKAVKDIPAFQTDGKFDVEMYKRATEGSYGSRAKFEEALRKDLVYQKMLASLREGVKVSDDEVKESFLADNDKAELEFVRFPYAQAKAEVKVSDADAQAWASKNAEKISKFYADNKFRYDKPKRVRARHILVKVDEKATPKDDEAARKKIEDLKARIQKGADFAALAADSSDDPGSKSKGGDLDFFGPGVMAKPFEDAAFSLKPGELSPPVKTRFGWHLIKAEAVEEPKVIPLEAVTKDIARELLEDEQAKSLAMKKAEEALVKAKKGEKLADLYPVPPSDDGKKDDKKKKDSKISLDFGKDKDAASKVPHVESTGPFAQAGDYVPKMGSVAGLAAAAFKLDSGQVIDKVWDTPQGALVAQVKERQKPDLAKLADKKADILTRLRNRRETEVEQAWLKALKEKAQIVRNQALVSGGAQPVSQPDFDG